MRGLLRRLPQEKAPERQVEPPEVLRMADVLQVVEYGYTRNTGRKRRREPGIQQNVDLLRAKAATQAQLLKKDTRGAIDCTYRLRAIFKPGTRRHQVRTGLAIREDQILMGTVNLCEGTKQLPQVDLRAANPTGEKIKGVDANAERGHEDGQPLLMRQLRQVLVHERKAIARGFVVGVEP
jgi:hypothetical protein